MQHAKNLPTSMYKKSPQIKRKQTNGEETWRDLTRNDEKWVKGSH